EGMEMAQQSKNVENIKDISALLSKIYSATGRYKQAYEMHVLYKQMADSMSNLDIKKSTFKKQAQYDFARRQESDSIKSAERLAQENLKHEQQIHRQQMYTYAGSICALLMVVVAAVSFRAYRQKQKSNMIINR